MSSNFFNCILELSLKRRGFPMLEKCLDCIRILIGLKSTDGRTDEGADLGTMVFLIQFFPMFLYELPRDLCTVHATSSDTRKGMRKILVSDLRSRTIYDRSPPSHITQYRDIISCTFVSTVFVMEVTRGSSWFLGIVYHKQDNDDLGFEH
jgi:hypothetical protein